MGFIGGGNDPANRETADSVKGIRELFDQTAKSTQLWSKRMFWLTVSIFMLSFIHIGFFLIQLRLLY